MHASTGCRRKEALTASVVCNCFFNSQQKKGKVHILKCWDGVGDGLAGSRGLRDRAPGSSFQLFQKLCGSFARNAKVMNLQLRGYS